MRPDIAVPTALLTGFARHLMTPRWRWTAFVAIGTILILAAWLGLGTYPSKPFDLTQSTVPLDQIVEGGPGRDGIPAILHPHFVSAGDATFLQPADRVLGVSLGGEAKAYPVKILNWHEIVNDSIDGKPIVVTYCPLCGSGIGFNATIKGRQRSFGVSGLLYQSDLLMYDHQTESLWSQIGMHAVAGPSTGEKLTPIFLEHTTWAEWHQAHPATRVLSTRTGSFRNYDRDPYAGYSETSELFFDTTHVDPRYHPKEWVVGIEYKDVVKAYPFSELKKGESLITDALGGDTVTIQVNHRARSVSVTDTGGRPIPSVTVFWFAWVAFHPDTQVFNWPEQRSP